MGGCVSGCMSSSDKKQQCENPHAAAAMKVETWSVDVPGAEKAANESAIRRSPSQANMEYDAWRAQFYGGQWGSLPALLKDACGRHGSKLAQGWRQVDKVAKEPVEQADGSKKDMEVTYYKERETISFTQLWERCVAFGNGLRELGLVEDASVGLYEETRAEWLQACYGIWVGGMIGVTVYANLGEDALIYAMKEAELPAIVLNGKQVPKLRKLCADAGIDAPIMIYTDSLPAGTETDGKTLSYEDVCAKGAGKPCPDYHSDPNKTSLIMYTSGTTGDPKGVVMSHGNLIAAIITYQKKLTAALTQPGESLDKDPDGEVYVGYLPLAHSLEFAAENVMLSRGVMIGYGNPRTLTNTAARPHGDLAEFKPSFFAGVPRIFDTIMKGVKAKLPPGGVKRAVFDRAYEDRKAAMEQGLETPYYNEKVFKQFKDALGGNVRCIASGAAPLNGQTQIFMEVVFGVSVLQGYGLTETCACTTLQPMYDVRKECIGGPVSCVEIKLRDADVWKHTDEPHPRGEVLIRGAVVTQGYYKQPEKTKEAYTDDGWFCTGDVAEIPKDGTLKIIGRTKALAKNLNGEYIALESLETVYVQNELVMPNGACVLVNPQRAYTAAIVLTDESKAKKFADEKKVPWTSWPDVLQTDEFRKATQASLAATAKEFGRKPFEIAKQVRVYGDEWTPENGIMTAAMKLKRREIDAKYADAITELFAQE